LLTRNFFNIFDTKKPIEVDCLEVGSLLQQKKKTKRKKMDAGREIKTKKEIEPRRKRSTKVSFAHFNIKKQKPF